MLSLKISGEAIEGTTLVAEKKYWGGEEGDSVIQWFLVSGSPASYILAILHKDIASSWDFFPLCGLNIDFHLLHFIKLLINLQTSPEGTKSVIEGATTSSYTLTVSDIGLLVSVSCEPVRCDLAHGPIVTSEYVGPVVPGMFILKNSEHVLFC